MLGDGRLHASDVTCGGLSVEGMVALINERSPISKILKVPHTERAFAFTFAYLLMALSCVFAKSATVGSRIIRRAQMWWVMGNMCLLSVASDPLAGLTLFLRFLPTIGYVTGHGSQDAMLNMHVL